MRQGTKIKLTKIQTIVSQEDQLENNYWLIGSIIRNIVINESIFVWRTQNNRGEIEGTFISSPVKFISNVDEETYIIETQNSQWKLEILTT